MCDKTILASRVPSALGHARRRTKNPRADDNRLNKRLLTATVSLLLVMVLTVTVMSTMTFGAGTPRFPRWWFMWALVFALYAGLKWLSWIESAPWKAPMWKQAGYLFGWPGMDARLFLAGERASVPLEFREWAVAFAKCVAGAGLIAVGVYQAGDGFDLMVGWLEMIGLILLLHCGLFHLLSCLWRLLGVEARPIMNSPLLATSVADFWGRRWNLAFRDLTHRFIFRPLVAQYGAATALWTGFLVSGVVHELAITIPAQSGYGGPTAFFLLQGAAIFAERSPRGRMIGLGRGWLGWIFTAVVLTAPVGLLFPPAFVRQVIVPFCRDIGRLALN